MKEKGESLYIGGGVLALFVLMLLGLLIGLGGGLMALRGRLSSSS